MGLEVPTETPTPCRDLARRWACLPEFRQESRQTVGMAAEKTRGARECRHVDESTARGGAS